MIVCDEIIYVTDAVSTKMTSTIATNAASTKSINFHNKIVRYKIDCYTLLTVLLAVTVLLIITIICYHYAKDRSDLKNHIVMLTM